MALVLMFQGKIAKRFVFQHVHDREQPLFRVLGGVRGVERGPQLTR